MAQAMRHPVHAAPAPRPARLGRWRLAVRSALAPPLAAIGHAFGSIFFIPQPWIGLVLALAVASQTEYAAFALTGLAVGAVLNRLLGLHDDPGSGGGVQANALMGAVVTGWVTGASGIPWEVRLALGAAAALPAGLLAAALSRFLARSAMPAALLGYCVVASMLFAICPQCTVAASNAMPAWPQLLDPQGWAEALLRSLAAILFAHDWASGAFVALAVLAWSRALFACGIAGWAGGAVAALAFERLHLTYFWLPLSYNFFVAGGALGAVLFLPGRASLPLAAAAGALTSFFALALQYALHGSSTSYLPLSSALAIWVGVGALAAVAPRAMHGASADDAAIPPERRWWTWAYARARFGVDVPLFAAPVAGELLVTQAFAGKLSHAGRLPHALDFERPRPAGVALGAIHGAEVLSPVAGTVERVRSHVADNPPGVCNYAERWGNYVVIRLDDGRGWALLAHLQQGSVAVAPGMRVEVASYLARVGNSGRSTFAHLHMQLQSTPEPGSATRPFRLANYVRLAPVQPAARPWVASAVPSEGEVLMAARRNASLYLALAGIAPGTGVWTVEAAGRVPRAFREQGAERAQRIEVTIDALGRHVFTDARGGSITACLDPDAWRIVAADRGASPLLQLIALAVPTLPYGATAGTTWTDLPPLVPDGGLRRALGLALAPYLRQPFVRVSSTCIADPGTDSATVEVRTRIEQRGARLPLAVRCTCAPLRGPVRVRAEFAHGSITYSLLSYEAGGIRAPAPR